MSRSRSAHHLELTGRPGRRRGRRFDVDGNYSYSNRHTMIGLDVQLVIDLMKTRSGTLGVVVGFGVFR